MNHLQLKQYLKRIGLSDRWPEGRDIPLTQDTLNRVQLAQLEHVPYENLDLLRQKPLDLTPEGIFRKIVEENRGGYCFEVNGLLGAALRAMGFSVTEYAARMLLGSMEVQSRRHRVLGVRCGEKTFLCDAGMNREMQRAALELVPGRVQTDGVSEYRLERDDFYGWVLLQKLEGHDFWPVYAFTEEPQTDLDYEFPSFWCEKHPDSPLNKSPRVSIVRGAEHWAVRGDEFTRFARGEVQERRTVPAEEQDAFFEACFGIPAKR